MREDLDAATAARLWADLERLGPFFAVDPAAAGPWRPMGELAGAGLLERRVATGRPLLARLAGVEETAVDRRAVVSVVALGLAGRLVSPAVATALCHGCVIAVPDLEWQPSEAGPLPLHAPRQVRLARVDGPVEAAAALDELVLRAVVQPLLDQAQALGRLAPSLLRGNLASGLAGAVAAVARVRPDVAPAAQELLAAVLELPALRGVARRARPFVRRTCCLYYRVPRAGTCGDCPLPGASTRSG